MLKVLCSGLGMSIGPLGMHPIFLRELLFKTDARILKIKTCARHKGNFTSSFNGTTIVTSMAQFHS